MGDEVGVEPERLAELASALENLRNVLAANVPVIVNTLESYWESGAGQPISLTALKQAQARSPEDAADMRMRSDLAQAWMNNPANIDVVSGGLAYIPWDGPDLTTQDATLDATELAAAEKDGNRAQILAIETDIKDHLAEGSAGQAFLTAFYNQAAPQVAALAAALYAEDGNIKQPLTTADEQILKTFATGLAATTATGSLSPTAMKALTNAPDMWSMAMLVKYGPDAKAYGTGQGQQLVTAVNNATVEISPHIIVAADNMEVPALRTAWAWALKRHISLASTSGDVEFSRWIEVATVSPYSYLFATGQLHQEFASMTPDPRIEGTFNSGGKVLLTTGATSAAVFLTDPRSLVGQKPAYVEDLIPKGEGEYEGPQALTKGDGWKYLAKGRSISYEEGNPTATDLGQPDSLMHQGPYFKISENGYVYRIAAEGNPALGDSNAATISISRKGEPKQYDYGNQPTDDPADGDGDGGDLGGEGGGGGDPGVAGE
ncbi:MAG: hypothetical protein ABSA93_10240 [Streptosporangiaceae bacterium]|jgi:hypothetical protein